MVRTMQATAVWIAFSLITVLGSEQVDAASSRVGVSIHFEIAPVDLFRAHNVEPEKARSCESLKAQVDANWTGKPRRPVLDCSSPTKMPLIITNESESELIVRP